VQTTIYKTLHRKLNLEQHGPHKKPGLNSDAKDHDYLWQIYSITVIKVMVANVTL